MATLDFIKKMCFLCLKAPNAPLSSLTSTDQNGMKHLDKIAASLTKIASLRGLDSDCRLCEKCVETIDMIYKYNRDCLKNIVRYVSYKTKLKRDMEKQKQCDNVTVKTKKLESNNSTPIHNTPIKKENEICGNFVFEDTVDSSHPRTNSIVTNEVKVLEEVVVKCEVDKDSLSYDDEMELDFIENIDIKKEIEETNKEYWKEDDNFIGIQMEAGTSSKVSVVNEGYLSSDSEDKTRYQVADEEEFNLSSYVGKSPESLNVHLNVQPRAMHFKCDICKTSFSQVSALNRHIQTHKPHSCIICKKVFEDQPNLNAHMLTHSGGKPYTCIECGRSFSYKQHFVEHKTIHTGEKAFPCDLCDKTFARRSYFIQHRRTHTGEKPYYCGTCNKQFTQKSNLNYHKKLHNH